MKAPDPLLSAIDRFPDLDARLARTVTRLSERMPQAAERVGAPRDGWDAALASWARDCRRIERAIVEVTKVRCRIPDGAPTR
ncbi:MAG TPA: hypothetical protein VM681_09095 [Candidatus Thermoplasmatota archaeon]|nr:hypothetical protein [Candidatus Thermoplasmatota archaeon]